MKNILKYALLTLFGAAAFSMTSYADVDPSEVVKLSKEIIAVNADQGEYKIRLETYVTGSSVTHTEQVAVPIDLVLVLDVSSSMRDNTVPGSYNALTSQGYSYDGYGNKKYYYCDEDGYYLVERGRTNGQRRRYYLHFTKNGTTFYLSGTGTTTIQPTNVSDVGTTIWTGVLYSSTEITRLEALKEAVTAFIDKMQENAAGEDEIIGTPDDIEHNISIVSFSRHEKYVTGTDDSDFHDDINDDIDSDYSDNFVKIYGEGAAERIAKLKSMVENLSTNGGTRQDRGILGAKNNLDAIPTERFQKSSKVVVMFTDGAPYAPEDLGDGIGHSYQVRNHTCEISYILKSGTRTSDNLPYKTKVFCVSTGITPGSTNDKFMQYASSNYPQVTGTTGDSNTCNPIPSDAQAMDGANFSFNTESGSNLTSIFQAIAESSTEGGETYPLDKESTTVVDVVSNNFVIPEGTKPADVDVWVETYWRDDAGVPHWADENDTEHFHYSDGTIPVPVIDGNTLSINGFDFAKQDTKDSEDRPVFGSGNWVGPREFEEEDGTTSTLYWGNRLVIEFPIKVNPDYEGGYAMPSNDIESGLYVNGTKILEYPVPTVDFPSICIMKDGLKVGESALFEVTGPNNLKYTVRLTQNGTDPCYVILKRLNGGLYTVKEMSWSWMYSAKTGTSTEISQNVIGADALGLTVEDFLSEDSTAEEIDLDGVTVGMKINHTATVDGKSYTGTFCVLKDKEGEYTVDELKGCAISLLYHFSNTRITTDKPARAEAYAHNEFKGGNTGGGTETGGNEEEDI